MIPRPRRDDFKLIGFYTGKVVIGVGGLMAIPLLTAFAYAEWQPALDFVVAILACVTVGLALQYHCRTKAELGWTHGMVIAAFSWFVATLLAAIPYYLSGHLASYLDCVFDVMSGFTTTGLYLLQDLDHVSNSLNMWRHLLTYAGGQGIVVIALSFLVKAGGSSPRLYIGEGKDEKLLPNVVRTARAIWLVSLTYLVVGTLWIGLAAIWSGMPLLRGFLHGSWLFMGAWSTGGFAPQSYNIGYYHSLGVELATMSIFIIGSFNFALHWSVWTGNRKELRRNIEIVSFTTTLILAVSLATFAMARSGLYPTAAIAFRKIFYQTVSGHTTTGFMTIYSREFVRSWSPLGMMAVTMAMAIGASAASTAGGIKGLRVGMLVKGFFADVRRLVVPQSAVITQKIHHITDKVLEDDQVRSAATLALGFIVLYLAGAILLMLYGYPLDTALFESVSAGSNSGLSAGITSPSMPSVVKVFFIAAMWLGRLEFLAIFALIGFAVAAVRGK